MYSAGETIYDPYAPQTTIIYAPVPVLQQISAPLQVSTEYHTVRDVAAALGVARNSTQFDTIVSSGYGSFKCYHGCSWNSTAAAIRLNCHGLRIEHFYKQLCLTHGIPCHPHFSAIALHNIIRQGLVHAKMGVELRMRLESPHQSTLCEACGYGQTVLH